MDFFEHKHGHKNPQNESFFVFAVFSLYFLPLFLFIYFCYEFWNFQIQKSVFNIILRFEKKIFTFVIKNDIIHQIIKKCYKTINLLSKLLYSGKKMIKIS